VGNHLELYCHNNPNNETLSSVSEKSSCLSNGHLHHHHHLHQTQLQTLPRMATVSAHDDYASYAVSTLRYLTYLARVTHVFQEDRLHPHALSTYLVDPPLMARSMTTEGLRAAATTSPYIHRGSSPPVAPIDRELAALAAAAAARDAPGGEIAAIYSVVSKDQQGNQNRPTISPRDFEETESEYAVGLRRQAYLQAIGENGGYGNVGGQSVSSLYSASNLPPPPVPTMSPPTGALAAPAAAFPPSVTTPSSPPTVSMGPAAAVTSSSPGKRAVSAFTTFGQQPLLPPSPHRPAPTTGHLV